VREGVEALNAANEDELDMLDRSRAGAQGARLACQVSGAGEVLIELPRGEAPVHAALLPVSVSQRAAEHFVGQLAKHPGVVAVRLVVEPSGCSGHRYRIQPADAIRDGDRTFNLAATSTATGSSGTVIHNARIVFSLVFPTASSIVLYVTIGTARISPSKNLK
jgi:Fe-S cluster assembly iron-binding protein IscA